MELTEQQKNIEQLFERKLFIEKKIFHQKPSVSIVINSLIKIYNAF